MFPCFLPETASEHSLLQINLLLQLLLNLKLSHPFSSMHKLELQQLDQFSTDVGKIFPVTANIRNGSASIASGHVIAFNNSIRIIGTPNTISTLIIETNVLTTIKVAIQVIMSDCSPGFVFNKENQSCQCSAWNDNTSYNGITYCKH